MSNSDIERDSAAAEFRRMMKWILLAAIVMVAGALGFAAAITDLTLHMAVAMVVGVLISVLLGSGLFALAFFSDKSGHDRNVTEASTRRKPHEDV